MASIDLALLELILEREGDWRIRCGSCRQCLAESDRGTSAADSETATRLAVEHRCDLGSERSLRRDVPVIDRQSW